MKQQRNPYKIKYLPSANEFGILSDSFLFSTNSSVVEAINIFLLLYPAKHPDTQLFFHDKNHLLLYTLVNR